MNTNNTFIDSDEKALGILGADYLNGSVESDPMEKGIVTLTDKRLYFKGKSYTEGLLWYKKQESTKVVDVTDLVDMEVKDRSKKFLKYLAMLPVLYIIVLFFKNFAVYEEYAAFDSYIIMAPILAVITILINAIANKRKVVDKRNWFNYFVILAYLAFRVILVIGDNTDILGYGNTMITVRLLLVEGTLYTLLYCLYVANNRKFIEFIFVNGSLLLSKHDYSTQKLPSSEKQPY